MRSLVRGEGARSSSAARDAPRHSQPTVKNDTGPRIDATGATPSALAESLRAELSEHLPIRRVYEIFAAANIPSADHYLLLVSLMRAQEKMHLRVERSLVPHRLSLPQYILLSALQFHGQERSLLLGQLAKRISVHPTTVTIRMEELEKRGLVRREPAPKDRRATLASITEAGNALLVQIHRELSQERFGADRTSPENALTLVTALLPQIESDIRQVAKESGDTET